MGTRALARVGVAAQGSPEGCGFGSPGLFTARCSAGFRGACLRLAAGLRRLLVPAALGFLVKADFEHPQDSHDQDDQHHHRDSHQDENVVGRRGGGGGGRQSSRLLSAGGGRGGGGRLRGNAGCRDGRTTPFRLGTRRLRGAACSGGGRPRARAGSSVRAARGAGTGEAAVGIAAPGSLGAPPAVGAPATEGAGAEGLLRRLPGEAARLGLAGEPHVPAGTRHRQHGARWTEAGTAAALLEGEPVVEVEGACGTEVGAGTLVLVLAEVARAFHLADPLLPAPDGAVPGLSRQVQPSAAGGETGPQGLLQPPPERRRHLLRGRPILDALPGEAAERLLLVGAGGGVSLQPDPEQRGRGHRRLCQQPQQQAQLRLAADPGEAASPLVAGAAGLGVRDVGEVGAEAGAGGRAAHGGPRGRRGPAQGAGRSQEQAPGPGPPHAGGGTRRAEGRRVPLRLWWRSAPARAGLCCPRRASPAPAPLPRPSPGPAGGNVPGVVADLGILRLLEGPGQAAPGAARKHSPNPAGGAQPLGRTVPSPLSEGLEGGEDQSRSCRTGVTGPVSGPCPRNARAHLAGLLHAAFRTKAVQLQLSLLEG